MKIKQIYTGCLAQGAYYIESKGELAIIDPLREVQDYIDEADKASAKIKYIFETHFHADFVSGHVTLSEKTGAPIIYGPSANPSFDCIVAEDEQVFELGEVKIKVLHTPGHTMESVSYLLIDKDGKDYALFSGDTLFLGDVGRPDLAQKAASMTQEELAGTLFDSLRNKLMTLADDVIVYPGHGAGSACGKNMSKETDGSIGEQKESNYALRADMTKDEFVAEVLDGILPPPAYFPLNVKLNKEGYQDVTEVINRGKTAIKAEDLESIVENTGALILDVRHQDEFGNAHIPKSIFIGIDGGFAPWVGTLIKDVQQPLILVVDPARLEETITRLSRVGFDNVLGHVDGGVEAWKTIGNEIDRVKGISANTFEKLLKEGNVKVKDVRKNSEYLSEHVLEAENTPLDFLNDYLESYGEGTHYIHCAGGYRSMIAASILKSRGVHNIVDVQGGFAAIKEAGVDVSAYVCPSTL